MSERIKRRASISSESTCSSCSFYVCTYFSVNVLDMHPWIVSLVIGFVLMVVFAKAYSRLDAPRDYLLLYNNRLDSCILLINSQRKEENGQMELRATFISRCFPPSSIFYLK